MPIDEDLMRQAITAAEHVAAVESDLVGVKAEYRRAVRRLHLEGASMREIAEALGISHQRVHQILDAGPGPRRWRRRGRQDPLFGQRACSFCGRGQFQAGKMIAGPGVHICGTCIAGAAKLAKGGPIAQDAALHSVAADVEAACSFCGKHRAVVATMVSGASSGDQAPPAICSECLTLCQDVVGRDPDKPMIIRVP